MTTKVRGIAFILLGLAALAAGSSRVPFHAMGIPLGAILLLLGASAFSNAGQLARALRPLVKASVRVEVWGAPLPGSTEGVFEIDSVLAYGAGLLFYLRPAGGGPRSLLKVAQPSAQRLEGGNVEIDGARYVSWAGTKLKRIEGTTAPALMLRRTGPNS